MFKDWHGYLPYAFASALVDNAYGRPRSIKRRAAAYQKASGEMAAVIEYAQPVLIALAVLLVPACARLIVKAMQKKLDEGRDIAEATAEELKKANAAEAQNVAQILEQHREETMTRLERIENQTTATNGKVAAHDMAIVSLQAKTELLTEIYLGRQPDKGA